MKTSKAWHGVRLRWVEAAGDPDAAPLRVQLPASWDDGAASAVAAMMPDARIVALPDLAASWITGAARRADEAGCFPSRPSPRPYMICSSGGAACRARRSGSRSPHNGEPRFVFNLPAFFDAATGFDLDWFGDAVEIATVALTVLRPEAPRLALGFADLDGLLACLGLDYGSAAAREVATALAALLRGRAELVSARLTAITGRRFAPESWGPPPAQTVVPGLAEAAAEAFAGAAALSACGHERVAALSHTDAAEALLGVETTGLAPAFARTGPDGAITRAARHWLAARGLSAEAALAKTLQGEAILPLASAEAHAAMHAAVAAIMPVPSLRRVAAPAPAHAADASPMPAAAVDLPVRRSGTMQKVSVGGHRLYLRTAEYTDGKLGEIGVTLQKEAPAFRALMESFGMAVSIGLQHGVPLDAFVEAFIGTRFGAAGVVDGDPTVGSATSIIDYVFRHLAQAYLGRSIPDPEESIAQAGEPAPTLPLDLPRETPEARRRRLRLVS